MANVTNAEAIKFVKEVVRVLAEEMRALKIRRDAAMNAWYGGINALIPNTSDVVVEGRESEGIPDLTGAQVNSLMSQLDGYSPNAEIIQRPCVRQIP